MSAKEYCIEISKLLKMTGERLWYQKFEFFVQELEESDEEVVLKEIRSIYGGLGSFNDLVLYKNGKVCSEENEMLDQLRKKLFEKIKP